MNSKIVFIILIIAFQTCFPYNSNSKEISGKSIKWEKFETGFKKAKEQNKLIMIYYYSDWCHWCKVMEKETFSNKEVIKILAQDFIPIKVNIGVENKIIYKGKETTSKWFGLTMGIRGTPSITFMDNNGNYIHGIPGYIKTEMAINLLNYFKEGCHKKKVAFQDFVDKKTSCE